MDLNEIRGGKPATVIDTTRGKVEAPDYPSNLPEREDSKSFKPTRIGAGGRTPVDTTDPGPTNKPMNVIKNQTLVVEEGQEVEKFDMSSLPKKEKELTGEPKELMDNLVNAVDRECESITERVQELTDAQHKEFLEQKAAQEEAAEATSNVIEFTPIDRDDDIDFGTMDDEDVIESDSNVSFELDTDEDDDAPAETLDERNERLKNALSASVKTNLKTISKKIDLGAFSIADTPMAASKVVSFSAAELNMADWVMPNSGHIASFTGLSGPEILNLDPTNHSNKSKVNIFKTIYSIIYKHYSPIDGTKPTFDEWLKTTKFSDLQHMYFGLFKATFNGSSFAYYECKNPDCDGNVFISEKEFEDYIVYDNDTVKERIEGLMNDHVCTGTYETEMYQVSDDYVIAIREPSIWNTIETASLTDKFLDKYESIMDILTYTDAIYYIDRENSKLVPIDCESTGSVASQTASRIRTYGSIIRKLSADNYTELKAYIIQNYYIENVNDGLKYCIPETICEACGEIIPQRIVEATVLLFTRQQLGAFKAM